MKQSRRKELAQFVLEGRLREALEKSRLSEEATNLAVDVILRYCESNKGMRHRRSAAQWRR